MKYIDLLTKRLVYAAKINPQMIPHVSPYQDLFVHIDPKKKIKKKKE